MAIKPILFNTEMVRAILDGRKTCTRRIVKDGIPDDAMWGYTAFTPKGYISCRGVYADGYSEGFYKLPYQPGDILYVRETWQYLYELDGNEQVIEDTGKYYYAATDTIPFDAYVDENGVTHDYTPWRPSIHMPKEAARIWLKVTDVRVERLQEITEVQAQAEGCNSGLLTGACTARGQFEDLWNTTIKKSDLDRYGWNTNPYVWVIEFERCEKPQEV
nr:MAG TPA: ASCH domain protein [Caudoviricetes sp.]